MKKTTWEERASDLPADRSSLVLLVDSWANVAYWSCHIEGLMLEERTAPLVILTEHPLINKYLTEYMVNSDILQLIRKPSFDDSLIIRLLDRTGRWHWPSIIDQCILTSRWLVYSIAYSKGTRMEAASLRLRYAAEIFPIFKVSPRARTLVADIVFMIRPYLASP